MHAALRLVLLVLLVVFTLPLHAAGGDADYLAGLDALETGRYPDAAAAFTRAIEADDENFAYHQARGVARVLSEKFPEAIKDFQRSMKLKDHEETRLWLAAAYQMSDQAMEGSKWFTHGRNMPRDYPDLVYSEMAGQYWSSKTYGEYYDIRRNQRVKTNGPRKELFSEAAAWYVKLHKTAGAAGGAATTQRMKELYGKGDYAGCMRELRILRATRPDDAELLSYYANCSLALGDAETARTVYTRLATANTRDANLYIGRALAAARLGDARRMESDLTIAQQLGAKQISEYRATASKRLAALPIAASPAAGLAALQQAIAGGAAWEKQVELAIALQRSINAGRKRLDEKHQDELRVLEAAAAKEPRSADRLADLGLFLWKASTVRGERVNFRAPVIAYRHVQPGELERARKLAEQALQINASHAKALVALAHLQLHAFEFGDAEQTIRRLAGINPRDEELPMLYAQLLEAVASIKRARAADLREVKQWSDTQYIYTRWPSDAELARADALQREAERLEAEGLKSIDDAAARFAGKPLGFYYRAAGQRARGQSQAAVESLKQMVSLDAGSVLGWSQLAGTYEELGMKLEAAEARATATNLVQTTATPLLELTWTYLVKTKNRSARQLLDRAIGVDAGNPRVFAYLGITSVAQEKPEEAALAYRTALALEEARLRLAGGSISSPGAVEDVEIIGVTCAVRQRLASLGPAAKITADEAMQMQRDTAALHARFNRSQLTESVHSALMPDEQTEEFTLPTSPSAAALIGWARLRTGDALLAAGKPPEAEAEYQAVLDIEGSWPATAPGRQTMAAPAAWARLGRVKALIEQKNFTAARQILRSEGFAWGLGAAFDTERKRVEELVNAEQRRSQQEELDRDLRMTPQERMKQWEQQRKQAQRESLEQQKAVMEELLKEPNIDARQKQQFQQQLERLEQQLKQLDAPATQTPPESPTPTRRPVRPQRPTP